MTARTIRWSFNLLAVILLLKLIFLPLSPEYPNKIWAPYLIFALSNWLFADILFRLIPTTYKTLKKTFQIYLLFDFIIALIIAFIAFKLSNRFLFDDAGFVLRYIENFKEGHFYKFNPQDSPVFGLSGFVYGIVCFAISIFGFSAPVSVKLACFIGTTGYFFVLLQLCRHLIEDKRIVWLCFIILAVGLENIIFMFTAGLELPIHITIILTTILFYLKNKERLFLLFSVLSVMSKLDAAPLIAILIALYSWEKIFLPQNTAPVKNIIIYFIIPLVMWVLFAYFLFGSPLPQSAFAKYYYHRNPDKHSFPFLHYFLQNPIRKISFIILEVVALLHFVEILFYRKLVYVKQFILGYLFIGIMATYYFYDPFEKMIWYYSLPQFLLSAQVIYSFIYWSSKKILRKIPVITIVPLLVCNSFIMKTTNEAHKYHQFYIMHVEQERSMIGNYLYDLSTENDTLMSSHGLVSWRFKGYVMDLSGLNSKLVTNYKRNSDSLLLNFRPHYIVNHAWPYELNKYGNKGYEIDTVFADVTLFDYPFWVIMKRTPYKKRGYSNLNMKYCTNYYDLKEQTQVTRFFSDSLSINIDSIQGRPTKLWAGVKREETSFTLEIVLYNKNEIMNRQNIYIEKAEEYYVSKYVKGISVPTEYNGIKATSISIIPKGIYSFACFGPLLEYTYE